MKKWILMLMFFFSIGLFAQDSTKFKNYTFTTHRYTKSAERFADTYLGTIEYGRKLKGSTVIGRFNYFQRGPINGELIELDYYPTYDRGYGFFSIGYGPTLLFQRIRLAAELYRALPKGYEASLGARYMYTADNKSIVGFTGTFARYIGNGWISFRPMILPLENGIARTFSLTARQYTKSKYDYFGLVLIKGIDIDQSRNYVFKQSELELDIYVARFEFRRSITKRLKSYIAVDYTNEFVPYNVDKFIATYGIDGGLNILF